MGTRLQYRYEAPGKNVLKASVRHGFADKKNVTAGQLKQAGFLSAFTFPVLQKVHFTVVMPDGSRLPKTIEYFEGER